MGLSTLLLELADPKARPLPANPDVDFPSIAFPPEQLPLKHVLHRSYARPRARDHAVQGCRLARRPERQEQPDLRRTQAVH